MKTLLLVTGVVATAVLSGCATVPTASPEVETTAKQFSAPAANNAGIYVYRKDTIVGAALKKDVWINGECIGETAPGIFFYHEVAGGQEHKVSTESEFSPNDLMVKTEAGKLYFVEQYIKIGALAGGADVEQADEATGKAEVLKLKLAEKGNCSI